MAGTILENLSGKKLSILVGTLLICQLICFLIGGLIGNWIVSLSSLTGKHLLKVRNNFHLFCLQLRCQLTCKQFWEPYARTFPAHLMTPPNGSIHAARGNVLAFIHPTWNDMMFDWPIKLCLCLRYAMFWTMLNQALSVHCAFSNWILLLLIVRCHFHVRVKP